MKPPEIPLRANNLIRVVIVEDDRATREGLTVLVNGTPKYDCVASFRSVEDTLRSLQPDAHDVMLLDIDLPGLSGTDGVRIFKERFPSASILMLTVYAEEDKVFESICNGAIGYLLKDTPPARLLEAIREAHTGGAPMSPEIARKVVRLFQKTGPPEKIDERLTPQELRLLRLLVEGYSYRGAADHLHISVNTVRDYIRIVYEKLHVHSKSEAVTKALRSRIVY